MIRGAASRLLQGNFFRFLVSGGINTLVTYLIYLVLLNVASYQLSYSIAYVSGIGISYFLNRWYVFQAHRGMRSILLYPLVYMVQYGLGLLVLWIWIDKMALNAKAGPLIVVIVSVPMTYILSKLVFGGKKKSTGYTP